MCTILQLHLEVFTTIFRRFYYPVKSPFSAFPPPQYNTPFNFTVYDILYLTYSIWYTKGITRPYNKYAMCNTPLRNIFSFMCLSTSYVLGCTRGGTWLKLSVISISVIWFAMTSALDRKGFLNIPKCHKTKLLCYAICWEVQKKT